MGEWWCGLIFAVYTKSSKLNEIHKRVKERKHENDSVLRERRRTLLHKLPPPLPIIFVERQTSSVLSGQQKEE
jgi:hypothetical protein